MKVSSKKASWRLSVGKDEYWGFATSKAARDFVKGTGELAVVWYGTPGCMNKLFTKYIRKPGGKYFTKVY